MTEQRPCDCECHINAEAFDMDEAACDCFQDGEENAAGLAEAGHEWTSQDMGFFDRRGEQ